MELLAVVVGQACGTRARFGIVAVHVKDRRLDHLGDVGGIETRTRGLGRRGEADLIVDDDVDRPAHAVARELREVEGLGHDALAREGRVAVYEDRQVRVVLDLHPRLGAVTGSQHQVLLGAHNAFDDGTDRFEVRGVRRHRDVDGHATGILEDAARTLVVLDVAAALDALGVEVALEFAEDVAVGLAHDVGEHVETSAVRHGDHGFARALVRGDVEHRLQRHDRRLATLESESLLAHVARVQEALEDLGFTEGVENMSLLVDAGHRLHALDPLLDPSLLLGIHDVAVLDADRATVGVAQDRQDLLEGRFVQPGEAVHHEGALQVPDGQPVGRQVQLRVKGRWFAAEWIEVGVQMPAHPIHIYKGLHADLLQNSLGLGFVGRRIRVFGPPGRFVGHAERREDLVVEPVSPGQALRHVLQEQSRLGALDDSVVVGRGQSQHLAHAEIGERARIGRFKAGRPR